MSAIPLQPHRSGHRQHLRHRPRHRPGPCRGWRPDCHRRCGLRAQIDDALAHVRDAGAGEVRNFDADLRDPGAIETMMAAIAAGSPVEVPGNNAGILHAMPLAGMPAGKWNHLLAVNLSVAFHCMRLVLPGMVARGYGRVVNIAAVHGLVASSNKASCVASKVAALEYARIGSRESGGAAALAIWLCRRETHNVTGAPFPIDDGWTAQ